MSALEGAIALVTGASRGIGAATATALAQAGARVVRVARTLPSHRDGTFENLRCDVSRPDEVARMAGIVLDEIGAPDIVVNNAGVFDRFPLEAATVEEMQRQVAINLVGAFAVAQAFLPPMRSRGSGLHVSLGSVADHTGFAENSIYSATKYGLRGLHESLSAEYRRSGVRLTLVSPGPTDTGIWQAGTSPRDRAEMLTPADVADTILFVATRPARVVVDWVRLGPA